MEIPKLSQSIYKILEQKKMKQSLVAIDAGYSPKIFNAMLRGRKKIGVDDIPKICKALEVSPNELFDFRSTIQSA
jgi:Helix-turn-helix.